jgi:RimJ/RimL family protein N-acetyltransferase
MPSPDERDAVASPLHATVITRKGVTASLRDLRAEDVEAVVSYWHDNGEAHLDAIGIDRALLGTREHTRQRLVKAIRTGHPDQLHMAFAILVDGELAGYSLLNRHSPERNHGHWHIIRPDLRGSGLSTALYPHRIKMYFDAAPIERLIHQTRTRNVGVNRMLDRFVPIAETRYEETPDGVAAPGEFHIRYVHRADVPRLFGQG